jgi:hypothetical protein
MNWYEMKQEAKRQRLEDAADKARRKGNASIKTAKGMASVLPFGQPILIGHHSEKRDRNYRNRIHNKFRNGFAALENADKLEARAAAIGTGGISGDDPEACDKIAERIAELETDQARMAAVNKAHKAFLKKPDSLDTAPISDSDKELCRRYVPAYSWEPHPFAPYQLQNNNANIRRLKGRVELLAKRPIESKEEMIGEIRVVHNAEENRLQLFFPGKPAEPIRAKLKSNGFRWSHYNGCWQCYLSSARLWKLGEIIA